MSRDWKKNTVYRAVYHQARGLSPLLPFEGFVAAMAFLVGLPYIGLLPSACVALGTLCGLFAWRVAENDRADYALAFVRRLRQGRRCYNALGKDSAGAYRAPFVPTRGHL